MKFSKVASFAFLALSSQAALIQHDVIIENIKRDAVLAGSAENNIASPVFTKRESEVDSSEDVQLEKRISFAGIVSSIINQLPSIIQIIGNIIKAGLVKRDDIDDAFALVLAEYPHIVSAFEDAFGDFTEAKRDEAASVGTQILGSFPSILTQVVNGFSKVLDFANSDTFSTGLSILSNFTSIASSFASSLLSVVQNGKRDGVEDIVSMVVRQIPDLIVEASTPFVTNAKKMKRDADVAASLVDNLVKKGLSTAIDTFGAATVASVVSKRQVSSFLSKVLSKA